MEQPGFNVSPQAPRVHFGLLPLRKVRQKRPTVLTDSAPDSSLGTTAQLSTPNLNSSIRNLDAWTIRAKLSRERTFRLTKQRQFNHSSGFPTTRRHAYASHPNINLPAIDAILNSKIVSENDPAPTPGPEDPYSVANIIPAKSSQSRVVRKLCSDLSETDMQRQILSNILQSKFGKKKLPLRSSAFINPEVEEEAQRLITSFQAVRERITIRNLNLPAIRKAILTKQRHNHSELNASSQAAISGPMPEIQPEPILEELATLERTMVQATEQIKGIADKMNKMDAEIRKGQELIDEFCSRKVV